MPRRRRTTYQCSRRVNPLLVPREKPSSSAAMRIIKISPLVRRRTEDITSHVAFLGVDAPGEPEMCSGWRALGPSCMPRQAAIRGRLSSRLGAWGRRAGPSCPLSSGAPRTLLPATSTFGRPRLALAFLPVSVRGPCSCRNGYRKARCPARAGPHCGALSQPCNAYHILGHASILSRQGYRAAV